MPKSRENIVCQPKNRSNQRQCPHIQGHHVNCTSLCTMQSKERYAAPNWSLRIMFLEYLLFLSVLTPPQVKGNGMVRLFTKQIYNKGLRQKITPVAMAVAI